ncbi:hypothetical protein PG994_009238 [Apiospora phragmitis]|uniref:Uncharacterized protein n=1 Tax=Apiospora phragmitis TaxID=2905665 RepID=A0ABR1UL24_9PEZI
MALTQGGHVPSETEPPITIADFNTVLLSIAATLCGLFAVITLSVRHMRCEARQLLLRALRLVGFAFAYMIIGLVYVPIRILDCVSRAWPSPSSSSYSASRPHAGKVDDDDDDVRGCSGGSSGMSTTWLDKKSDGGGGDGGYGYEDEICRTRQDILAGGGSYYSAAASSSNYTRSNSVISDLDSNEASDLEKGVPSPWRNKTKPC